MRVLVSAASKHGATTEIAAAIGDSLEAHGHAVLVSDPTDVVSIQDYDALVLGSAIYAGHWQRSARALVDRFSSDLEGKPVWLFSSGAEYGHFRDWDDIESWASDIASDLDRSAS